MKRNRQPGVHYFGTGVGRFVIPQGYPLSNRLGTFYRPLVSGISRSLIVIIELYRVSQTREFKTSENLRVGGIILVGKSSNNVIIDS